MWIVEAGQHRDRFRAKGRTEDQVLFSYIHRVTGLQGIDVHPRRCRCNNQRNQKKHGNDHRNYHSIWDHDTISIAHYRRGLELHRVPPRNGLNDGENTKPVEACLLVRKHPSFLGQHKYSVITRPRRLPADVMPESSVAKLTEPPWRCIMTNRMRTPQQRILPSSIEERRPQRT